MASYNVYLDSKNYIGRYDLYSEFIPEKAVFASQPNELCISLEDDRNVNYNVVIANLSNNTITPVDKHIIGLIAAFGYVSTKQLREMLLLLGTDRPADKLLTNTDRLRRNGAIRAFTFGKSQMEKCNTHIYTLCKNGSEIAKVLGVNHTYNIMNAAAYPCDVKKVLVRNQGVLAFLKSGLPVEWFKIGTTISSSATADAIVKPSFSVKVEEEVLMYEVVRSGQFWENTLRDKLRRYKLLFDNFEGNNWKLSDIPELVMVGENYEHCLTISTIAKEIGLKVLFSDDLMSRILASNSSKYGLSPLFFNLSSFKANPLTIYSFKTLVAHILNSVAFLELILYPTAIMASKL